MVKRLNVFEAITFRLPGFIVIPNRLMLDFEILIFRDL